MLRMKRERERAEMTKRSWSQIVALEGRTRHDHIGMGVWEYTLSDALVDCEIRYVCSVLCALNKL
jgi:hypothetical protein